MAITHSTIKAALQKLFAIADWNAPHVGTATPEQHANEAHNPDMAEKSVYDAHDHSAADPTQVSHADLTNVSSDQHHAKQHSIIATADHTSTATSGRMLKADANGLPVNATNTDAEVAAAVTASHAKQHSIIATADHTSTATSGRMLKADANGLPVNATNTDAAVAAAVTASHTRQHAITDTADHTSTATSGRMLKADANGLPVNATNTDAQVVAAVVPASLQNYSYTGLYDENMHWLPTGMIGNQISGSSAITWAETIVQLRTGATINSICRVQRDVGTHIVNTWDKKRRLIIYSVPLPFGLLETDRVSWLAMGNPSQVSQVTNVRHIGWYTSGLNLYASVASGAGQTTALCQAIALSTGYTLEIVWTPATDAKFYVNGVLRATIALTLPSGTTDGYEIFRASIYNTLAVNKGIDVYSFRYIQEA